MFPWWMEGWHALLPAAAESSDVNGDDIPALEMLKPAIESIKMSLLKQESHY